MKNWLPAKRGVSPLGAVMLGLSVLVAGTVGTVGTLAYAGMIDLKILWKKSLRDPHAGLVAIPASGMVIPAYTMVTRDHLTDREVRSQVSVFWVRPEEVRPEWCKDVSQIIGRVMSHEKGTGYSFTEADFLPKGTRPGMVGGIPPGKRAMTLDASQVRGLKELQIGDRFDLLSSDPVDMQGMQPQVRWNSGSRSGNKGAGALSGTRGKSSVQVLVESGAVITMPAASPDAKNSRKPQPKEMTIAVAPEEIAALTEALAGKTSLFCTARSGHPDEKADSKVTEQNPLENVSVIETMRGRKFNMEAFPTADE